jgi:hypothetical protein
MEEAVEQPPNVALVSVDPTTMRRRLFYFFQQYDRSRLPHIEDLLRYHRGRESKLLKDLEKEYGPEPDKSRWELRDQISFQRKVKAQLEAQLRRAKDELLLLSREQESAAELISGVQHRKETFKRLLESRYIAGKGAPNKESGSEPAVPGLGVIRISRTLNVNPQDMVPEGSRLDEDHCYFIAPMVFFEFVREQAAKVHGAMLPPLCTVVLDTSSSDARAPKCRAAEKPQFVCNWSFLAGWAADCGPHSVAVASSSDNGPTRYRFVPSKLFWSQ